MQNVHIHILKASGGLEPFLSIIDSTLSEELPLINSKLHLSNIDIVICHDESSKVIPEVGVGGSTFNQNMLEVYIDPTFPSLMNTLEASLRSTLAHELHHAMRWQAVGYGTTLLQAMITEGLAAHFDILTNHNQPKPWDTALTSQECTSLLELAKKEWNNEGYDHIQWFFGKNDIPRWTGYSLGYRLISEYLAKNPNIDISSLTNKPAEEFI